MTHNPVFFQCNSREILHMYYGIESLAILWSPQNSGFPAKLTFDPEPWTCNSMKPPLCLDLSQPINWVKLAGSRKMPRQGPFFSPVADGKDRLDFLAPAFLTTNEHKIKVWNAPELSGWSSFRVWTLWFFFGYATLVNTLKRIKPAPMYFSTKWHRWFWTKLGKVSDSTHLSNLKDRTGAWNLLSMLATCCFN